MNIYYFILFNILILVFFIFLGYKIRNYTLKKKNKEEITIIEFLNNGSFPSFKDLLLGLIFGIVFGFIDNFGLWMGISSLEEHLPGGILTKSGFGNTYSDTMGAVIGTIISIIAADLYDYDGDGPIWLNTMGIIIGCLLGMYIGKLLTGKD